MNEVVRQQQQKMDSFLTIYRKDDSNSFYSSKNIQNVNLF